MTEHDRYSSPLAERYASKAMLRLWSAQTRYGLWRRLWLALAEAQKELGVPIPDEAIVQMRAHLDDVEAQLRRTRVEEVFLRGEQVEQQCAESRGAQLRGHRPVAWAVP